MSGAKIFEFEGNRTAAEAGAILGELADGLSAGRIEFGADDQATTVDTPSEVVVELELERERADDGSESFELEVELGWEVSVEGEADEGRTVPDEGRTAPDEGGSTAPGDEGRTAPDEQGPAVPGDEGPTVPDDEEPARAATGGSRRVPAADPDVVAAGGSGSLARFEVFRDRAGEWRWRLVHRNGNVIATSGEGYTTRRNAEKGLRSVAANAPGADVETIDE